MNPVCSDDMVAGFQAGELVGALYALAIIAVTWLVCRVLDEVAEWLKRRVRKKITGA